MGVDLYRAAMVRAATLAWVLMTMCVRILQFIRKENVKIHGGGSVEVSWLPDMDQGGWRCPPQIRGPLCALSARAGGRLAKTLWLDVVWPKRMRRVSIPTAKARRMGFW